MTQIKPKGKLISREPWWAKTPAPGASDFSVEWGYLEHYEGNHFVFVHERPGDSEIRNRKSCRRADS